MSTPSSPKKPYVTTRDVTPRMFHSDFMERFTHVHPLVPHFLYIPLTLACLIYGATHSLNWLFAGLWFLGGVSLWTLTEYILHRWVFHFHPTTALGEKISFLIHGVHHDYPSDSKRLVMPPLVSIPLCVIFFSLFALVLPAPYLYFAFPGYVVGYLLYDTLHFLIHHSPSSNKLFLFLKRYHLQHHLVSPEIQYGITSPFWDHIFRTKHK